MPIESALYLITVFGLGLSLVFALGFFAMRARRPVHVVLGAGCLSIAIAFLPALLHLSGSRLHGPVLATGQLAAFAVGPLFYIYFRLLSNDTPHHAWLHFAPLPLIALAIAARPLLFPAHDPFGAPGVAAIAAYMLATFVRLYRLRSRGSLERIVLTLVAAYTVCALLITVSLWLADHLLAHIGVAFIIFILITHFLTYVRNPALIEGLPRPGYDILAGFDREDLRRRLLEFMDSERPYCDEDLKLADLAREIGLSAHQLSRFLNESMGCNFYAFVNDYRVRAAMQMLEDDPGRNVLSIADAVGFRSKSSFHTAFLRIAGQSPQAYRRRLASGGSPPQTADRPF
jgi:AraC-like DNA-binding protein